MQDYTKIEVTGLPAIYPTNYMDRMYLYNEPTQAGIHEETFMSRKFKTINDTTWKERMIQGIMFDKYKLEIYGHRGRNIPLLKSAATVNITLKNEQIHRAKILELTEEELQGTEQIKYTLVYADTNPNNYRNGQFPANNPLLGSTLTDYYTPVNLNYIFISAGATIDAEMTALGNLYFFYTIIQPLKTIEDYEQEGAKIDKLEIPFNQTVQRAVTCYLYLNEIEKNILEKYVRICGTVQFYSPLYGMFDDVEPVKVECKEVDGGVDIYECVVTLKYENLNYYRYNT